MRTAVVICTIAFLFAGASISAGQTEPETRKLTAREVFYSAPKVAAKGNRPAPSQQQREEPQPPRPEQAANRDPRPEPPPRTQQTEARDNPAFIQVAAAEPAPLGMRCSVLKRVGPSDLIEVGTDAVFRSGDRIRLRVEVNDSGYLYVVHRGSSGVWKPLFPSKEVEAGSNRVEAAISYDIPRGYVFTFDEQPGEEKLFVVFARQPVTDLEKLIYEIGRGAPGAAPASAEAPKMLLAQNLIEIDDDMINRLRNSHARDLIVEKVDETTQTPGYSKEAAVYAVASKAGDDSRVVVDISLNHR